MTNCDEDVIAFGHNIGPHAPYARDVFAHINNFIKNKNKIKVLLVLNKPHKNEISITHIDTSGYLPQFIEKIANIYNIDIEGVDIDWQQWEMQGIYCVYANPIKLLKKNPIDDEEKYANGVFLYTYKQLISSIDPHTHIIFFGEHLHILWTRNKLLTDENVNLKITIHVSEYSELFVKTNPFRDIDGCDFSKIFHYK